MTGVALGQGVFWVRAGVRECFGEKRRELRDVHVKRSRQRLLIMLAVATTIACTAKIARPGSLWPSKAARVIVAISWKAPFFRDERLSFPNA